ncbi:uncharacterized protein EAF01_006187 [Botrytis porri]|uniref:uncharacterized protein n=1 Tax=Botrytis porri TaxID=87229 RepID=UPI0018FFC1A6|nr:uncharacterized protein EAF01_006187 [Botrytis porri]KAF7903138.1 hypothetical protein EAF01_006187 [Botrytis porri]
MATNTDALTSAPVYQTGLLANASDNLDAKISSKIHAFDHEPSLDEDGLLRPTEEERTTLRRISGSIPWTAYMICLIEFAERASYYGCQFVFSNFVQFPLPKGGNGAGATPKGTQLTPGALGKGLTVSSALGLLFKFLAYTVPVFGGWLADTKLGRFKTICIGVFVFGVAHLVLVLGALPSLFKSNVSPMLLDQDTQKGLVVKTLPDGERVILDPEVTAQRLALAFYGMVNVGAFFGLATTYSEKRVGFWLAYGLPMVLYLLLPILLWAINKRLVKYPPQGSDLGKNFRVIGTSLRRNGLKKFGRKYYLDAAKPSVLAAEGITGEHNGKPVDWDDNFVEDVKRSLEACTIFLFFPIYILNDGGIGNITTSQGSAIVTNDAPNDILNNFNALTVIVTIPILSYGVYPLLRRHKIHFGPIKRITFGFIIAAISSAIGAITQWRIYETSPCGYYATGCEIGTGVAPLSIWWQLPQWMIGGISECFCNVTALELAYSRAPANMKGLVTSMYLFATALSAAIAQACTPSLVDPYLIWPYVAPAVLGTLMAIWFYFLYRHLDDDEYVRGGVGDTLGEEPTVERRESIRTGDGSQEVRPNEKV